MRKFFNNRAMYGNRTHSRTGQLRIPVGYVVDNSPSTLLNRSEAQIKAGSDECTQEIQKDPLLRNVIDIAAYAFGTSESTVRLRDYVAAEKFELPAHMEMAKWTPLCEVLCRAIVEQQEYVASLERDFDQDCRSGLIFCFTDGEAGDREKLNETKKAMEFAYERRSDVILLACGDSPDMEFLQQIAQPHLAPIRIETVESFRQFSAWLLAILRMKSMSQSGALIVAPPIGGDGQQRLIRG